MISKRILNVREAMLNDLHENICKTIIILVGCGAWCLILSSYFANGYPPAMALLLWVALESVCSISLWIHKDRAPLAIYVLISGLWICNALAVKEFGLPLFAYIFSLVSIISSLVPRKFPGIALATVSSIFLLTVPSRQALQIDTFLPIILIWFSLITSFAVHRSLYQALDIAWVQQDYAMHQMEEARDHRRELMRLTKDLKQTKEELERANIQLHHARQIAEEAQRRKAQFAATVSHELRTPINLVVGFSDTVVHSPKSYGSPLPSAYWSDLNTIYRNARHLQGLINDVLDISQIEAGHMATFKEAAAPGQIIVEAAELVRDEINNRGLALNVFVPDDLPIIALDRLRIRQVILNLLGNAIRFTDTGAISVKVECDDSHLRICISDTGIGIQAADLGRVFEQFHQLDGSLSRRLGGTGLGLALSQQFVEMHGGRIWAESEGIPGKGSSFILTLPLKQASIKGDLWGYQPDAANDQNARCFVVLDDDSAVTRLFERYSERHTAIGVKDLAEAIHLVNTIEPSALVVNTQFDGQALTTRPEWSTSRVPIIECPMPSGKRALQHYGITDFLVKPVTFEMLCSSLQRITVPIRSILIVDDEPDMVRLFTRMLQRMPQPYQLRNAYTGLESLKLMQSQRPDLVILDLLLPDIDGLTVVGRMKEIPVLADVPVLLASAYGASDAIQSTAYGTLTVSKTQGFQPLELVQCIEAIVGALRPASEQE